MYFFISLFCCSVDNGVIVYVLFVLKGELIFVMLYFLFEKMVSKLLVFVFVFILWIILFVCKGLLFYLFILLVINSIFCCLNVYFR